jgi:hypothetical protein
LDIVLLERELSIWLNDGQGKFSEAEQLIDIGIGDEVAELSGDLIVGDLNNDGALDLVVAVATTVFIEVVVGGGPYGTQNEVVQRRVDQQWRRGVPVNTKASSY